MMSHILQYLIVMRYPMVTSAGVSLIMHIVSIII